jgi:rhodanese-related sulfurtransferase
MKLKGITIQATIIIIISVLGGLVFNSISDNGISLIYEPLDLESGSFLTSDQTLLLLNEGRSIFIDTRTKEAFRQGHLKNAINIPGVTDRDALMKFLESISKDEQIVAYCSSSKCNSSRRFAGFLTYLGYKKVLIYLEGYKEWEAKGYPIEK